VSTDLDVWISVFGRCCQAQPVDPFLHHIGNRSNTIVDFWTDVRSRWGILYKVDIWKLCYRQLFPCVSHTTLGLTDTSQNVLIASNYGFVTV
jgi:hypothetical protein